MAKPQHESVGFTKHLNGAVVPVDTTSVLQQKALHGAAHATAAVNVFKFPFYVRPQVAYSVKKAGWVEEPYQRVAPETAEHQIPNVLNFLKDAISFFCEKNPKSEYNHFC